MLDLLTTYYTDFIVFSKSNPLFAGILSVWGLGVITFCLRTVPSKIANFIYTQCTTNLVLNSYDNIYHEFLQWVSDNNMHSFVRNLNFNNKGRWNEGVPMISIGYGRTIFFFKRRLFLLNRRKDDANQTMFAKETIELTLLGRSHDIFSDLFEVIREQDDDKDFLKVHIWKDGWNRIIYQHKRPLDTVIIEEEDMNDILSSIDSFMEDKEWYVKNGIPYHFGLMFRGPSGTGKTSLSKGIATKYDKHLYIIHLSRMTDDTLDQALATVPHDAIVLIEDIDTANLGKRDLPKPRLKPLAANEPNSMTLGVSTLKSSDDYEVSLTLGGVLNALDGVTTSEGRILIATTNDIDSLDEALVRRGRFDVIKEIGYMSDLTLRKYLSRFYEGSFDNWYVNDEVKPCDVQQLVFENRESPDNVLAEVAHRRENAEA